MADLILESEGAPLDKQREEGGGGGQPLVALKITLARWRRGRSMTNLEVWGGWRRKKIRSGVRMGNALLQGQPSRLAASLLFSWRMEKKED